MKLSELLKTIEKSSLLKVGSEDGSGFWIVGTPNYIRENQDYINSKVYEYLCKLRSNAEERLTQTLRNPPTLFSYANEKVKNCVEPSFSVDEYIAQVKKWFCAIEARKRSLQNQEHALNNLCPILSRNVIEWGECDHSIEVAEYRILVSGTENGKFWTTDEADFKPCVAFNSSTEEQPEQD